MDAPGKSGLQVTLKRMDNSFTVMNCRYPLPNYVGVGVVLPYGTAHALKQFDVDVAHFIEHLFFSGTKTRTKKQIWDEMRSFFMYNAFTMQESMTCVMGFHPKDIERATSLVSDMVQNSAFPEAELEKERTPFKEEYSMYNDSPRMVATMRLMQELFKDHPIGRERIHTEADINRIKRENVLDVNKGQFVPEDSALIFWGNVEEKRAMELAEKNFSGFSGKRERVQLPVAQIAQKPETVRMKKKGISQTATVIGMKIPQLNGAGDEFLLVSSGVMMNILNSMLLDKLRLEKGLVYGAGATMSPSKTAGLLYAMALSSPKNANEVLDLATKEIEKLAGGEVTSERVDREKEKLWKASDSGNNDAFNRVIESGLFYINGMPRYREMYNENIAKVDLDSVRKAAATMLKMDRAVSVIVEPE
ncbi:MAG: insulinase family protein [Candidatus Micrarchaeales archaeon]|nr:insulinase family protein [Candidatus Micrarchaeales archaeon]